MAYCRQGRAREHYAASTRDRPDLFLERERLGDGRRNRDQDLAELPIHDADLAGCASGYRQEFI
jgi:hypothetical protein